MNPWISGSAFDIYDNLIPDILVSTNSRIDWNAGTAVMLNATAPPNFHELTEWRDALQHALRSNQVSLLLFEYHNAFARAWASLLVFYATLETILRAQLGAINSDKSRPYVEDI